MNVSYPPHPPAADPAERPPDAPAPRSWEGTLPPPQRPAVFLDRDGVLSRNCSNFVRSLDQFEIFQQAVRGAAALSRGGPAVVIVSNQSGIARGFLTAEAVDAMMDRLRDAIRADGGSVDGVYYCPHHPDDCCDCRKPMPGMLHRAEEDLGIDLSRSVIVGDNQSDIAAGKSAGLLAKVLVLTGDTRPEHRPVWEGWKTPPDHVAPDLEAAVPWILDRMRERQRPL